MSSAGNGLHARESLFHDAWALETTLDSIDVRSAFEAPTAVENQFILGLLGPLSGKRVLDIGSGIGESSVYFALQGARVTCADLSAEMASLASRLAAIHDVSVQPVVCPAEALTVPSASYDVVYAANTLHHVADKRAVFAEARRVLKPGGIFVSIDPLAYNPIINVYRRMANSVRTADERPLDMNVPKIAAEHFPDVQHREFWIATLALFAKYYICDRVHPNDDRYWKRILRETPRTLRWWMPLKAADALLTRIPLVKLLAWNIVMWGHKPA